MDLPKERYTSLTTRGEPGELLLFLSRVLYRKLVGVEERSLKGE